MNIQKRILYLVNIVILLTLFVGCSDSQVQDSSDDAMVTAIEYALDVEYMEAISACNSNVEISNTNNLYAQKWKDIGEYYYQSILNNDALFNGEEIKNVVTSIHTEWDQYTQQRIQNEKKRLMILYEAGTIIPVKLSQFEYDIYRTHALEMYEMCLQLYIDCNHP